MHILGGTEVATSGRNRFLRSLGRYGTRKNVLDFLQNSIIKVQKYIKL